MAQSDELTMPINLDASSAREEISKIERRGLRMPLEGTRGPTGREFAGLASAVGGGRAGKASRLFSSGSFAGNVLGGAILAQSISQAFRTGMSKGDAWSMGFEISKSLGTTLLLGAKSAGPAAPYVAAAGAALSIYGLLGPEVRAWWKGGEGGIDLEKEVNAALTRLGRPIPPRRLNEGEDVVINADEPAPPMPIAPGGPMGGTSIKELRGAAQAKEFLDELKLIRGLLGRGVPGGAYGMGGL